MTQKVGLITYLKLKVKALFKKRVGPSFDKNSSKGNTSYTSRIDELLEERKNRNTYKSTTSYQSGRGSTIKVNGKTLNLTGDDILIINGKKHEPGTPEYEKFKKEMDEFNSSMAELGRDMGKMGQEMADSFRNIFK